MFPPKLPFKVTSKLLRGTTGDTRRVTGVDSAAQLIDAEWETPAFFIVIAQSTGSSDWKLETGIDRGALAREEATTDYYVRIVLARSIALSFRSNVAGVNEAQAVVTQIDGQFDLPALIGSASGAAGSGLGIVNPTLLTQNASVVGVAANVASVSLTGANVAIKGWGVANHSPAGRNLYIRLGTTNASIASGGFTARIAPDGYYETPFGYTGPIQGIWDGADAAGFANVTII